MMYGPNYAIGPESAGADFGVGLGNGLGNLGFASTGNVSSGDTPDVTSTISYDLTDYSVLDLPSGSGAIGNKIYTMGQVATVNQAINKFELGTWVNTGLAVLGGILLLSVLKR